MVAPPILIRFTLCLVVALRVCRSSGTPCQLSPSASVMATSLHKQFPNHPGQACASAEGKIWAIAVRRMLPADWLALVDGLTPRSLLQYSLQTVPDALVFRAAADGDPGVPQSSVLTRTAERQRIEDANTLKTVTKEASRGGAEERLLCLA